MAAMLNYVNQPRYHIEHAALLDLELLVAGSRDLRDAVTCALEHQLPTCVLGRIGSFEHAALLKAFESERQWRESAGAVLTLTRDAPESILTGRLTLATLAQVAAQHLEVYSTGPLDRYIRRALSLAAKTVTEEFGGPMLTPACVYRYNWGQHVAIGSWGVKSPGGAPFEPTNEMQLRICQENARVIALNEFRRLRDDLGRVLSSRLMRAMLQSFPCDEWVFRGEGNPNQIAEWARHAAQRGYVTELARAVVAESDLLAAITKIAHQMAPLNLEFPQLVQPVLDAINALTKDVQGEPVDYVQQIHWNSWGPELIIAHLGVRTG